ncbi:MAG: LPS export ABC transporter permease LptG [Gammaproteobacteria bacterium]|nr:LPS export ABC transporter permease LptG [Gammaproteobacteria bacterium]
MKILDRYIGLAIVAGTGIALLVILGLDIFFNIIGQLDKVGVGTYTLWKMFQYVALTTPQSLYELFPMAALLGSLIGLSMLAANSELVAIRASGVPVWRIVRSVLQAGVLMLVVVIMIGELVAPSAEHYGQKLRAAATNKSVSFLGTQGLWVRDGNYYINVVKILTDEKLAGLTIYEFDSDNSLSGIVTAAQANYSDDVWQLLDVEQTQFRDDHVEVQRMEQLERQTLVTPELLSVVVLKPQTMSVVAIAQLVDYLEENGLDTGQYRYAFWGRLMTPVASLVMLLVSVPFVFGGMRSVTSGQRIFIGILVGFGFYVVSQISTQMGQVYAMNPLLATLAPSLLFMVIGILAIRKI